MDLAPDELLVDGRDLRRTYGKGRGATEALRGVSLQIHPGERVALVGPSGSGKSTLLHLLGAMDRPDTGRLVVAGEDLTRLDDRAAARFRRLRVGFVFQFFNLIPTLNALDNVALPARLGGQAASIARRSAAELLERVGLGDRGRDYPDTLSGGQQQRVALARALVHRPPLVLADEPTGALDRATGARILDLLSEVVTERGAALVIATHDEAVLRRADRSLAIRDGRVVSQAEG